MIHTSKNLLFLLRGSFHFKHVFFLVFSFFSGLIILITKSLIMIGSPCAYLSHNWGTITWVSNYRYPNWTFCNWIPDVGYPHDCTSITRSNLSYSFQNLWKVPQSTTEQFTSNWTSRRTIQVYNTRIFQDSPLQDCVPRSLAVVYKIDIILKSTTTGLRTSVAVVLIYY